jgi:uncharacterized repeat protein (TIGR03803 family)
MKPSPRLPRTSSRPCATLALLVLGVLLGAAWAQKESVLHSFSGSPDGTRPQAGLVFGKNGNSYGTTVGGGASGNGTVFKVTLSGKETVLYNFCSLTNCSDGQYPFDSLILDAADNLYGTTAYGGAYYSGTVFKVTPSGKETVLYSFPGGTRGANPEAGLVFDENGSVYGTTYDGGDPDCDSGNGCGVVFKVTPSGKERVLHRFTGSPDGAYPYKAGLVFDKDGNLYGTTLGGGANNCGTVFKVTPSGKETVLYSFTGGTDGANPQAGLVFDRKGRLYGTTSGGGTDLAGTVFRAISSGKETVLHSFANQPDGAYPQAGLVFDKKGNLYGTTYEGGTSGSRTAFEVAPSGKETVLYSFAGGTDGAYPLAALAFDKKGKLDGTTFQGGAYGDGTVFKLIPWRH